MKIELYPLEKVVIDGVSIHLGMEQPEVERLIGGCQFVSDHYYYYNNELAISYDAGKVNFVEFLGGVDGRLKPFIYGVSAFEADANEIYELLKKHNGNEITDIEQGYSYAFLNISVGVYREAVPENVAEMIEEAANFGNPMSEEEIQYEMGRANHWATIGMGTDGYYQQ